MVSSGWRWKMLCCSAWRSLKATRTNTTSVSTPAVFPCIIKVNWMHLHFTVYPTTGSIYYRHWYSTLLIIPGLVDGSTSVSGIKLPCRTHPHWLEPTIYQSETSSERSSTPSEGIGLEARSMVSVAVKILSQNAERNVKVKSSVLLGPWTDPVRRAVVELNYWMWYNILVGLLI